MIRLDATPRKLQIVLGGAVSTNQLPIIVSYLDNIGANYTDASRITTGATQSTLTNNGTAVDVCSAPPIGRVREVDYISVRNSDTAVATVTIRFNDNGTNYTLVTVTMAVGDHLFYTASGGWKMISSAAVTY